MLNITRESIKHDYDVLAELMDKYSNAIWEPQENQAAHYDNQMKLVRLQMEDVRVGLYIALSNLGTMINQKLLIED